MINVKEYFQTDIWGKYDWYEILDFRNKFIKDVFWFELIGLNYKSKTKYFFQNLLKYRQKYIKNIIYYLPACWYMLRACLKSKYKNLFYNVPSFYI